MTAITWNPANKSAATVLSGGNLTAVTTNANTWSSVLATQSYTSGLYYLEIFLAVGSTANIIIGVANASQSLANGAYVGSTGSTGLGYEPNNNTVYPGGTSPGQGHQGQIIGVKYNFTTKNIQFNINGGTFSAATSFAAITGPYFPALSVYNTSDSSTVNFGATPFNSTIPSGYTGFAASNPIVLLSNTSVAGATGGTTTGINTLGATLIVLNVAYSASSTPTPTDSLNNIWTPLTAQTFSATQYNRLFYCLNPNVGSSHTFSTTGTTSDLNVAAFSNVLGFDVQSGNQGSGNPLQPGSVTPTNNNSLVVTGLNFGSAGAVSIDSGFIITNQDNYSAGVNYGGALAYSVQLNTAAVNPNWTMASGGAATTIATFTNGSTQIPYWNRMLQMAPMAWEDQAFDDQWNTRNWLSSRREPLIQSWAATTLAVSKMLQFDVLTPPDSSVNLSKFVQYAVLSVPDNDVLVSKFVQYIILETPVIVPFNKKPRNFAIFFKKKQKKRKRNSGRSSISAKVMQFFIMT